MTTHYCPECRRPTRQSDLCLDCVQSLVAQERAFYHEHGQPHPTDPPQTAEELYAELDDAYGHPAGPGPARQRDGEF